MIFRQKTIAKKLKGSKTLAEAKKAAKVLIREIEDPHQLISATSLLNKNPRFREVWLGFEQEVRQTLSAGRFSLLMNRLDLHYKPHLSNVRMDRLRPAMIQLRNALLEKGLHPNTVSDILTTPRSVAVYAFVAGLSLQQPPGPITVSGLPRRSMERRRGGILTSSNSVAWSIGLQRHHTDTSSTCSFLILDVVGGSAPSPR